jgi:hypothetical protein
MCFECHQAFRRMVVPLGAYATRRVTLHLFRDSVAMKEGNKTDQTRHAEQYCPDWLARQIAPLRASEPMTAYPEARASVTVSRYREYPVPVPLNGHLMCVWTHYIIGSENLYAHRVLPDGCVDICIHKRRASLCGGALHGVLGRTPAAWRDDHWRSVSSWAGSWVAWPPGFRVAQL